MTETTRVHIGAEEFIRTHVRMQQAGKNRQEIADELGVQLASYQTRFKGLVKDGVPLEPASLPASAGRKPRDNTALAALATKLMGETDDKS